jgi:hypothetical protein
MDKDRRFRFTLLALFAIVTAVAIAIGLVRPWFIAAREPSPDNWPLVKFGMTPAQVEKLLGRARFVTGLPQPPFDASAYQLESELYYEDDGKLVYVYYKDGKVTRVEGYKRE